MLTVLSWLWSLVSSLTGIGQWFHDREERREGRVEQQNADLKAAVSIQDKMEQAAAGKPKTKADKLKALREGKV